MALQQQLLLILIGFSQSGNCMPNVIYMFADDIGWNDVQFTSSDLNAPSTDTITSNLNKLASEEGVILDHYYVHRMCSPTRAAFMTGRMSYRYAMDTHLLAADVAFSLTRQVSLLSEEFKAAGYSTHAIGKWHLGFQAEEYTPLYRGFDSFYGYYNAFVDYYASNYNIVIDDEELLFYDLRDDAEPVTLDGINPTDYGIYRFRDRAMSVIEKAAAEPQTPFFMYLAWQSSHLPSEAPDVYLDLYSETVTTTSTQRQYNQAQTSSMDEAVGDIVALLKQTELWQNTLLVWSSDNGAEAGYGDNFPLRGYKKTTFEGGLRVPAFVTGGYLPSTLYGSRFGSDNYFIHVTDWYPTLLDAAGIQPLFVKSTLQSDETAMPPWKTSSNEQQSDVYIPLDGASFWQDLVALPQRQSQEDRLLIIDIVRDDTIPTLVNGTVRLGAWKYMKGLGSYDSGDGDNGYLWGDAFADIDMSDSRHLWGNDFANLDVDNSLGCDLESQPNNLLCFYTDTGCLFNIANDPCEFTDLSYDNPQVVSRLRGMLENLASELPNTIANQVTLDIDSSFTWIPYDTSFWGPYQSYQDVAFETMLYQDFSRLYIDSVPSKSSIPFVATLGALLFLVSAVVYVVYYFQCSKSKEHNKYLATYGTFSF